MVRKYGFKEYFCWKCDCWHKEGSRNYREHLRELEDISKVSIIIPALNEGVTIGKLIGSLVEDPYPDKEIIVVDGGSNDNTVGIARGAGALVIEEKNTKCPANARNQGAEISSGGILCFLDADNEVNPFFITNAMRNFADPDVVSVRSKMEYKCSTWIQKTLASIRKSYVSQEKLVERGSPFTFIRRWAFEGIGGYPLLGIHEDTLMAHKLRKYLKNNPTKKITFEPNSIIFKGLSSSIREFYTVSGWRGRTIIPYLKKSRLPLLKKLILLTLPIIYQVSIASIFLSVFSRWFLVLAIPYAVKMFVIMFDIIRGSGRYRLLTPIIDFVSGMGYLVGLLQYSRKKKNLSRGI